MSVLFGAQLYGKSTIYYDPNGTLGASAPTGPNIVRWMVGGRSSLTTVNGSNLGTNQNVVYAFSYKSAARFLSGNSLTQGDTPVLLRIGRSQYIMKMSMIYPQ